MRSAKAERLWVRCGAACLAVVVCNTQSCIGNLPTNQPTNQPPRRDSDSGTDGRPSLCNVYKSEFVEPIQILMPTKR
jgi:hypothetical protein